MFAQLFRSSLLACCLISLANAGERIITLTPHATELVFAAGAGDQIIATVESSDFPEAAKAITRIGDGLNTSAEQVIAMHPDVVIGWPSPLMSQLQSLGIRTIVSDPNSLEAIAQEVLELGTVFGTSAKANAWLEQFTQKMLKLAQPVPQDPDRPLRIVILASADGQFAIGRHALINDTINRCGISNAFEATQSAAPQISRESLLAAKPDVIISGTPLEDAQSMMPLAPLHIVAADWLYRPGPRFIDAALEICALARQTSQAPTKP